MTNELMDAIKARLAAYDSARGWSKVRAARRDIEKYAPQDIAVLVDEIESLEEDLVEARAEVAKLRSALAAVDRIAGEMEEASTPHGYTGQMVRTHSKWAAKIAEALDPVRLP